MPRMPVPQGTPRRGSQILDLPEPGDKVTVHRKNGSTSVETIREVDGLIYLPTGRARLDCFVE